MILVKKKLLPFIMGMRKGNTAEKTQSQKNNKNTIKRNARELHYEHQKWMGELEAIKEELIILAGHNKGSLKKDFVSLLKICIGLQKSIHQHESTLAMAFKACGINDYDNVFSNHKNLDNNLDSIRTKLKDLKYLLVKYRESQFLV